MTDQFSIISADSHVNPPPTFWREYLPARFREAAPRLEETDAVDYIVFEGERRPVYLLSGLAGKRAEDYKMIGKLSEMPAGGWDPRARLADLDLDGLDAEALFGGGPLGSRDRDLHLASYRAYNTWLADFCSAAPGRFLGMAYIPIWEVEEAIAELEFARARGLRGAVIPAFPPAGAVDGPVMGGERDPGRNYFDPEFDRFWQTAVELGMPIHMHLGARRADARPEYITVNATMGALAMAEPIAQFIHLGLFERFPNLKLVSVESGVGWFAFLAEFMDGLWEKYRYMTASPLKELPSFYMDRQVYGTFLEDHAGIRNRNAPGAKNIMWSSDYPHSKTTWPHSRETIARQLADVPEPERAAIVGGTAARLYALNGG